MQVLLAEDDRAVRESLVRALGLEGYDVAAVSNGVQALDWLASNVADIVLLECVPSELGKAIRNALEVPVIGIGAGPDVDGQILVLYDIIGLTPGRKPRFVRDYSVETKNPLEAVRAYVGSVKDASYPAEEHCFS